MYPYTLFDIEADGLYDEVTKVYCFSYQEFNSKGKLINKDTLTTYQEIRGYLSKNTTLIGHNIIRYDIPVLEKILDIKVSNQLVDTLAISWYLYSYLPEHSLDKWGSRLGIKKVEIEDWKNLSIEQYIERCEIDVEINVKLFRKQINYLQKIYSESPDNLLKCLKYLSFKMDCLKDQELSGIVLDIDKCKQHKKTLKSLVKYKLETLSNAMPKHLGNIAKKKPKIFLKKDGEISALGQKWLDYLEDNNLSSDTELVREPPNPGSTTQLKAWLYELGWVPETYEVSKNTGLEVEKVTLPFGGGLCDSVKALYKKEPVLEELETLYMLRHRLGIFKAFLRSVDKDGKIYSTAHGFTNTLRLKHGYPIVNLPGVGKPWGKEIRECLKVPNNKYLMCGSDISGLEDSTKMHYMYFFDPDYVKEMSDPDFCGHLDIALFAGLMTQEEVDNYKNPERITEKEFKRLKGIRSEAKTINFGGLYGIGPDKLARQMGIPLKDSQNLHEAYWKRNNAVKLAAASVEVKLVNKQSWLLNPISGLYLFLKEEKDKFSTLNQSSGVYVFDVWLKEARELINPLQVPILMQYHDELMLVCKKELRDIIDKRLQLAIERTNDLLRLNVNISIDTQWGLDYSETH